MRPISNPVSADTWPCYHNDYQFAMSGAHRKPAYEIGAPSISWHTGFWKHRSDSYIARTNSPSFEQDDQWIRTIENLILHVYDNLKQEKRHTDRWTAPSLSNLQPLKNNTSGALRLVRRTYPEDRPRSVDQYNPLLNLDGSPATSAIDPNKVMTRYETVHIDGVWRSMPLDIRFEVSGEYFTITTTIDFSRMREQPLEESPRRRRTRPGEFDAASEHFQQARGALYDVIARTNTRHCKIRSSANAPAWKDLDVSELQKSAKYLYFDIWDNLKEELFYGESGNHYIENLGSCFVDFRNLALQRSKDSDSLVNPWRAEENGSYSQNPKAWRDSSLRTTIMGHPFKEDDLEWVDTIHPILLSLEPDAVNNLSSDPVEYTFTKFCNDRCIYGSGFGAQIEDDEKSGRPLTYILLFGFDEHRQMGRLIYRLHTLGTLRHAALFELRVIKNVYDHRLDDIESKMVKIQRRVSRAFKDIYCEESKERSRQKGRRARRRLARARDNSRVIGQLLTEVHNDLNVLDGVGHSPQVGGGKSLVWISLRAWR